MLLTLNDSNKIKIDFGEFDDDEIADLIMKITNDQSFKQLVLYVYNDTIPDESIAESKALLDSVNLISAIRGVLTIGFGITFDGTGVSASIIMQYDVETDEVFPVSTYSFKN